MQNLEKRLADLCKEGFGWIVTKLQSGIYADGLFNVTSARLFTPTCSLPLCSTRLIIV